MNIDPAESDPVPTSGKAHRRSWIGLILVGVIAFAVTVPIALWLLHKTPAETAYERGRKALLDGEFEIARAESEKLLATPGLETYGWLLKGHQLALAKRFREAIDDLQKAAANPSLIVESKTLLARCQYQAGLYLQAIDSAQQALEKDPTAIDARRWLAAAYYDLGANSHATAELNRISDEAPDDPRPDRLLGLIAKDGEQYPLAIQHYQKAILRNPPDLEEVLRELAESQMKVGRFDDALESLKRCHRTADVLTIAGSCQIGLGRFPEGEAELRDALRIDERSVPAMLALGNLALDQGNSDEAIRILSSALKVEPQNRQVHFQLSQALRARGQVEDADAEVKRFEELRELEQEFSSLHGEAAKAPADARIRSRLGELALQLHKPELALLWFRAALALDPNDALSRSAINEIQRSQPARPRMR